MPENKFESDLTGDSKNALNTSFGVDKSDDMNITDDVEGVNTSTGKMFGMSSNEEKAKKDKNERKINKEFRTSDADEYVIIDNQEETKQDHRIENAPPKVRSKTPPVNVKRDIQVPKQDKQELIEETKQGQPIGTDEKFTIEDPVIEPPRNNQDNQKYFKEKPQNLKDLSIEDPNTDDRSYEVVPNKNIENLPSPIVSQDPETFFQEDKGSSLLDTDK
jgi:hypothetical protein